MTPTGFSPAARTIRRILACGYCPLATKKAGRVRASPNPASAISVETPATSKGCPQKVTTCPMGSSSGKSASANGSLRISTLGVPTLSSGPKGRPAFMATPRVEK